MSEFHASMSPSRLERIIACPGSYKLCQTVPEQEQSSYAAEGTLLHTYAEQIMSVVLTSDFERAQELINDIPDAEHRAYVEEAVRFVRNTIPFEEQPGSVVVLEQRVYFPNHEEEVNGTLDFGAYVPGHGIWIMDYKFGFHEVQPFNNPQLLAYFYGFIKFLEEEKGLTWQELEALPWYVGVVQPKIGNFTVEYVPKHEIYSFAELIARTVKLANMPGAPFRPSEKACKWCEAATVCRAHMDNVQALAQEAFAMEQDIDAGKPVTDQEICDMLAKRDQVEATFKRFETYVFGQMLQRKAMPGFKLVRGRSSRNWKSGTTIDDILEVYPKFDGREHELVETKMLSPAKVEKLIPAKLRPAFNEALVTKSEGNITLAHESSTKPSVNLECAETAFAGEVD